jgi:hypothetical protein
LSIYFGIVDWGSQSIAQSKFQRATPLSRRKTISRTFSLHPVNAFVGKIFTRPTHRLPPEKSCFQRHAPDGQLGTPPDAFPPSVLRKRTATVAPKTPPSIVFLKEIPGGSGRQLKELFQSLSLSPQAPEGSGDNGNPGSRIKPFHKEVIHRKRPNFSRSIPTS